MDFRRKTKPRVPCCLLLVLSQVTPPILISRHSSTLSESASCLYSVTATHSLPHVTLSCQSNPHRAHSCASPSPAILSTGVSSLSSCLRITRHVPAPPADCTWSGGAAICSTWRTRFCRTMAVSMSSRTTPFTRTTFSHMPVSSSGPPPAGCGAAVPSFATACARRSSR